MTLQERKCWISNSEKSRKYSENMKPIARQIDDEKKVPNAFVKAMVQQGLFSISLALGSSCFWQNSLTAFPRKLLFLCKRKIRVLYQRLNNLIFLGCCFSKRLCDRWDYLEKVSNYSECCNLEDRGLRILVNRNNDV